MAGKRRRRAAAPRPHSNTALIAVPREVLERGLPADLVVGTTRTAARADVLRARDSSTLIPRGGT